jgi:hypothetical protein
VTTFEDYYNQVRKYFLFVLLLILAANFVSAQDKGTLSGDFQSNAGFYQYDNKIGTNTQQYFHQLSSAESWLLLNYRYNGYTVTARYDLFNNSPLVNPQEAYTAQGIGFYSITKDFDKLSITAGSFYDQFGSGIIFRAFEERTIGLDYAVQGVRVRYAPNDSFMIKAFTGLQKNRFDLHPEVIKGANAEKVWGLPKLTFVTGAGITNRTLDQTTIHQLSDQINAFTDVSKRFDPKYNVYAYTFYNTLRSGEFTLYSEYAQKTKEASNIDIGDGNLELQNKGGDVIYGVLNYSHQGIGVNLQYKKINSFILRTSPYDQLLVGQIDFLPPLSKQNAFRLPARYSISALEQGEQGVEAEVTYSINPHNTFDLNASHIELPNGKEIYREYYGDYNVKFNKRLKTIIGGQYVIYDQHQYQLTPNAPVVHAFTPFTEWTFKLDRSMRKSVRVEAQYMFTRQDLGDFAFGLVEFNWAPSYSISASDMINTRPVAGKQMVHYPTLFGVYTYKQTRFTAGYIKQVEGVVCTGGVCRVEPAFSGFKIGLSTNF